VTYIPPDTLQAAVERGQISQMNAMDILAKQNAQAAAVGAMQTMGHASKMQAAAKDVEGYIEREPALRDPESPQFKELVQVAGEIALDAGLPAHDMRVHRMAMRQVFGRKEQVKPAASETAPAEKVADPLVGVSKAYIEHWERLGYTPERMKAEAKFVTRVPRKVAR
jgi:hypothetical protein